MTTPNRHYDVVAMSFPIVYTNDGDHDRDGLLYTLECYRPLLRWARARWSDQDERLPELHRRRQLVQIVVDGLWRYERMVDKLARKRGEERELLDELDAEESSGAERLRRSDGDHANVDPRLMAIRQNYRATVAELLAALAELTHGAVIALPAERATRIAWARQWAEALTGIDHAVATWFHDMEADPERRFDAAALSTLSGVPEHRVRRLLLNDHSGDVRHLADRTPPYDRFNPMRPIPLVRPLILRANRGETVEVRLWNGIENRYVGMHVQGGGLGGPAGTGVRFGDGADVGDNPTSLAPPHGSPVTYRWTCEHEGAWPINDLGDVRGSEQGTNVHGLFGALVVEPPGATWWDPETGEQLSNQTWSDGADVDIRIGEVPAGAKMARFTEFPVMGPDVDHREFTVVIHDEPEVHSALHLVGEHSVMPLSYRAEPMPNRLPHRMRRLAESTPAEPPDGQDGIDFSAVSLEIDDELGEVFRTARDADGRFLERVAGEEQHHSSWLFGEPVTPIFRAYKGDPARVRVIHAGIKETHVYHLHVHQWRAIAEDPSSQLLDSVTIGPQTAVTIDPLCGSGSRQHAVGDVIWHCHLYPHFHHGMWGLWRSFDRLVDGVSGDATLVAGARSYPDGRFVAYPDGTPCHPLQPLRGRPPEAREADRPGFPWFIDAAFPQKSPPPPALRLEHLHGRRQLLGLPMHSPLELAAFAPGCVENPQSGALFVDLDGDAATWNRHAGQRPPRVLSYDVVVRESPVLYNSHGWHDRRGHHYQLTGVEVREDGCPPTAVHLPETVTDPARVEPFFPRANHGDVVELRLHNELGTLPPDHFDLTTPPVECGLHVHLVKFDVLSADGSSTGWNYLSGASCTEAVGENRPGRAPRNVSLHRWVVDEEFGPCFFHDHLLANYRQKHGLFAALIAEPYDSEWRRPDSRRAVAWSGSQAVVVPSGGGPVTPYREACLAVGDFIPLYDGAGHPLNAPEELGSDDDPGAMGVNYRCAPLRERGDDPSEWFATRRGEAPEDGTGDLAEEGDGAAEAPPDGQRFGAGPGDPDTPVILTYPGDRMRIRLVQGSHEEQHSFSTHGLRWRREWKNCASTLVNQQTLGISEAFTLDIDPSDASPYGPGDHLWQFGAMDDLWLGCWGLVRALPAGTEPESELPALPADDPFAAWQEQRAARAVPPRPERKPDGTWTSPVRTHVVVARRIEHEYAGPMLTDPWGLVYERATGWTTVPDQDGLPKGRRRATGIERTGEPLVLRAARGEWVRVVLINEVLTDRAFPPLPPPIDPVLPPFGVEPSPPRLPIEPLDDLGYPSERSVSPRVSMHPGLLLQDVISDDGANVGHNHDGTIGPLGTRHEGHGGDAEEGGKVIVRHGHGAGHATPNWTEYWWYADPALAPESHVEGPGHVCYLQDMADVRNHRHHGLIGALVVEPGDVTPVHPRTGRPRWHGSEALLVAGHRPDDHPGPLVPGQVVANEKVLLFQDGLRHFLGGDPQSPVRDTEPGDDPEDAGQKGINYRTAVVNHRRMLDDPSPGTPVWEAWRGQELWLRLVCAADKPRNHTFTLHGHAWRLAPWVQGGPWVGSLSGLSAGWTRDIVLSARELGDHAYRSGAFRWAVTQGLWGILRVGPAPDGPP